MKPDGKVLVMDSAPSAAPSHRAWCNERFTFLVPTEICLVLSTTPFAAPWRPCPMTDHKANPKQWVRLEERRLSGNDLVCAALELRAKVEALEAKSQLTPNDRQIRTSLVKRVHSCIVGEPPVGHMQARSVIREVSEWLRERAGGTRACWLLDAEVDQ
jgi:hypothetical protein